MSTQHTPGRLSVHHDHGWLVIESSNGDLYLKVEKGSSAQKHMADARRLVACWNALIDLPQEALDGGWTRAGLEAHALRVEQHRDELLAALRDLMNDYDPSIEPGESALIDKARAAIAKVEGGAA